MHRDSLQWLRLLRRIMTVAQTDSHGSGSSDHGLIMAVAQTYLGHGSGSSDHGFIMAVARVRCPAC